MGTALGDYAKALVAYDHAIERQPNSAEALTGRGLALTQIQKYPEAIAALQASLALNPQQHVGADGA